MDSAPQQMDGGVQGGLGEEENTAVVPLVIALTELAEAEQVIRAGMTGEVEILLDSD